MNNNENQNIEKELNEEKNKKSNSVLKDIIEVILTALIIFGIIQSFFILSNVNQTSMFPTFKDGDFIVATRGYLQKNEYKHGDIILFNNNGRVLIKRVIGKENDHIVIKNGDVYLNNNKLTEKYAETIDFTEGEIDIIVPTNQYFVLGDNRDNSLDSRNIGTIHKNDILGKVRIRIFPETKIFK